MLLNKRPGVLVHDDAEGGENTLILHIKAYLYSKGEYDPADEQSFAPALCNRIDRNTGGIVIAAKDAESLRVMNEKIRKDELRKYYLCLVHGKMPRDRDTLRGYLRKDSSNNIVTVKDEYFPGAKEIITKYRVIKEVSPIGGKGVDTLLEVELVTGRTHQIRVHMKTIGHPLFADEKYGGMEVLKGLRTQKYKQYIQNCFALCPRQVLHAKTLGFTHPRTGERMHFDSPWAEDMLNLINKWRNYEPNTLGGR